MLRLPGPLCGLTSPCNVRDGTSTLAQSPRPGPVGLYATAPVPRLNSQSGFGGSPLEESKSLLRPCLPGGRYGSPLTSLPKPLSDLVGRKFEATLEALRSYLKANQISETDLGGTLSTPLPRARYFVIHDTSYLLEDRQHRSPSEFPENINDTGWIHNRPEVIANKRDAHVFIARTGSSHTAHDFSVAMSATKYTQFRVNPAMTRQLQNSFCHTELIQPRLPARGKTRGDARAPSVGFPSIQLERLAVVYVAASFRHNEWLVPAYHHNIDLGLRAHDDPQNFNLVEWAQKVDAVLAEITNPKRKVGDFPRIGPGRS